MSLAILASRALYGYQALPVRVEVHVGSGLPTFVIVGLPDAGVRESRERVRSALQCCGFEFPAGRITVNLAPADLPKDSGRYDLAIALGILIATGQAKVSSGKKNARGISVTQAAEKYVPVQEIANVVFVGELSLTGELGAIKGALAIAMAVARETPSATLVMPPLNASIAIQVPGIDVRTAGNLREVVDGLSGELRVPVQETRRSVPHEATIPCLADVRGQAMARRALEIAASGGHSLLMYGPPGVGKSMLAQRLPGLLPRLTHEQSLEVAALQGLAGRDMVPCPQPPFRAPHHTASSAALIGGGAVPRPGEISLAHHGVLFLDELLEFHRAVLESLREPLESGFVSIARARLSCTFPARFQMVAAMNPCPCGWLGHPRRPCTCSPSSVQAYRRRLSGPLLDRIDLHIGLPPVDGAWLDAQPGEPSHVVRTRVMTSRARQLERQGCTNAFLDSTTLLHHARIDEKCAKLLREASERWSWSARVGHRILRTARTLADMSGERDIALSHLQEALLYRPTLEGG
jgi:Mg chelatase-related protein